MSLYKEATRTAGKQASSFYSFSEKSASELEDLPIEMMNSVRS